MRGAGRGAGGERQLLALLVVGLVAATSVLAEEAAPRRVVSLAPSVTEIVFALGAGDRLVGVSAHCDFPEAAKSIDRVGTFLQPNLERILAKRPDLVIAVPSPENRRAVEKLIELGLKVRVVRPEKVEQVLDAIDVIAADLGLRAAGETLVAGIRADIARSSARVATAEPRTVLMVVGRRPLIAAGAGTYQDELLVMAGGVNVAAESGEAWPHLSIEKVIVAAPQVIIDTGMDERDDAGAREFWQTYDTIPAVRDGRVAVGGGYDLLRPGPRMAQTLAKLVEVIHPELGQ